MNSNTIRNLMIILFAVFTASLIVVAVLFFNDSRVAPPPEPEEPAIKVLAPFEMAVHRKAFESVVADYCAMPGKPLVTVQYIPQEVYQKEVSLQLDQGGLADIIICENVIMPSLVNMGVLLDITDYIEAEQMDRVFHYALWHNARDNNRYYGAPFTYDPVVLFYNKQMLARKNLSVPKDWNELALVASRAQELGRYGFGIAPRQPEEISSLFMQTLYSADGSIREINSDGGLRFFEIFSGLKAMRVISSDTMNWNLIDLSELFMDGQVAMMAGSASASSMMLGKNMNFDVGVAALPYDKRDTYLVHGKNIGVTVTANAEPALDFLKYLSSRAAVKKIADGMDTIPVRTDVDYDPGGKAIALEPEFVKKQINSGIAKSSFRTWFDISGTISEGVHTLLGPYPVDTQELADDMQDMIRISIINK